jgi:hypothetical protein
LGLVIKLTKRGWAMVGLYVTMGVMSRDVTIREEATSGRSGMRVRCSERLRTRSRAARRSFTA